MSITQRCSKCGRLIPVSEYSEEGFKRQVCKECERAEQEAAKPKTKVCECCGRELPIESFFPNRNYKDGHNPKCKECVEFLKSDVEPKFKTCTSCGKTLPTYLFFNKKGTKDGKCSYCKMCQYKKSDASRKKRSIPIQPPTSKVCSHCGRELPIEMFFKNKDTKDGYGSWCKDCQREDSRLRDQKKRMRKLIPGWTAPTQEDIDRSVENIATPPPPQRAAAPTPPKVEQEPTSSPTERPMTNLQRCVRSKWLYKQVMQYGQDCPFEMLTDFYKYWSQSVDGFPNLMLFENEKTWITDKRLRMWKYCCEGNLGNLKLMFPPNKIPQKFQDMLQKLEQEPTPPKIEQDDIDRLVESIPYPPDSPQRIYDLRPPKIKQPVEQATYSPQTLTIRFKAGDKVIRLKDGIFLLEQLSGKAQVNMGEKPEILYETTDGDMVADKDLFKNKREALERTKLAGIPEERLTYGNKPIK